ncbi:MAG: lantibiotic dehydratase family protein, partial [Psychrobium sp.]|nr:lantibiotic dehydratase family protein [Psychrobium sp.]
MSPSTTHQPFFVIRTPRLALEQLNKFGNTVQNNNETLDVWLAMTGVQEALYLASPSLMERIIQWQQKPDSPQGKKIAQALTKYMIRMCSRPTPFGLFSGIHLGEIGEESKLEPANYTLDNRKTRLDMFYLSALKEHFIKHNARGEYLKYTPNASNYFVAKQCRYIEPYLSDNNMQYRLSAIENDDIFNFSLNTAKQGLNFNSLVQKICDAYIEAEKSDVEDYVQDLVDERVLVADVPLPLTGSSPDHALLRSLQAIEENKTADHLATALEKMEHLDAEKLGEITPYKLLIKHLKELPVKVQENKLFQTDIYRNFTTCQLNKTEISLVQKQLALLSCLSTNNNENPLSHFITKFNERFEGQFVPLNLVLDDESGISISNETGYEAP